MLPHYKLKQGNELESQKSLAPYQPARRADLREVVAGKARIRIATAGCARGRSRKSSRRESPAHGHRWFSRGERDRSSSPLHAPFDVELRDRPGYVSAWLLHHEVQPARK